MLDSSKYIDDSTLIYDENKNPVTIPKELLPVKLPEKIDLNAKGNPLSQAIDWVNLVIDGKKYKRETDTLDTFVDSSWYFLRFCSPDYKLSPFDEKKNKLLDAS